MSKVVKSAVDGVKKVFKGVGKVAKKIGDSDTFRVIGSAALLYFGGAALSGSLQGFREGGLSGALSGAGGGLSSAWGGVTNAWSSLLQGNIGQAGGDLVGGITGAGGAGQAAASQGVGFMDAVRGNFTGGLLGGTQLPGASAPTSLAVGTQGAAEAPAVPAKPWEGLSPQDYIKWAQTAPATAIEASRAEVGDTLADQALQGASGQRGGFVSGLLQNPYTVPAAMMLGGNMLSGKAQQEQVEDQRAYEEQQADEAIANYGRNIGTRISYRRPTYQSGY